MVLSAEDLPGVRMSNRDGLGWVSQERFSASWWDMVFRAVLNAARSAQHGSLVCGCIVLCLAGCATSPPEVATVLERSPETARPDDQRCVAMAMYWEARGEGRRGMEAVGAVVLNRVASSQFPDTPCNVVFQGGETPPCQFSWWCDGKSDAPTNSAQWRSALASADSVLQGHIDDPTHGALFFHSTGAAASWHRKRERTARIGNHVFYR